MLHHSFTFTKRLIALLLVGGAVSVTIATIRPVSASSEALTMLRIDVRTEVSAVRPDPLLADISAAIASEPHPQNTVTAFAATPLTDNGLVLPESLSWTCVAYAPNGTCIPHRADLYTWYSGVYPYAPRPQIRLDTAIPVATNTRALLNGSVTCTRPGWHAVALSELRGGVEHPIGTTIVNGSFTMPWQVSGPTGVRAIRVTVEGPCGIRSQVFQVKVTEVVTL